MSSHVVVMTPEELQKVIEIAIRNVSESLQPYPQKKNLLTAEEVEQEFGIKRRLLEKWRCTGQGPSYTTIGKRLIRYERSVLESWISSGRVRTTGYI